MRIVVVALFVLAASCAGGQKAESGEVNVKLRRVVVGEADYERMVVNVVAVVENGTSGDVKVSNGTATVTVEGQGTVGSAAAADAEERGDEAAEEAEAPAEGGSSDVFPGTFTGKGGGGSAVAYKDSEVVIPVTLDPPDDPEALGQVIDWKSAKLRVSGSLDVNGATKTFGGAREVPPPRLPAVVLKEAQVASQDQGRNGAAFFKVGLDNKNTFDVEIDRVAWSISVGGKELRPAGEGEREKVPASSVVELEDQVELDEKAFGKELKTLLKQPTVPYTIDGFLEVKGMKRPFHFEGEMQFAR
jgi:hypothetical protein